MSAKVEEMYQEAVAYLDNWQLEQAEEVLDAILSAEPEHARAWNKLGVVFARRKDLRQAEDCFNQAIVYDSKLASSYSNLGNIYAERGWDDRAKTAYETALALDPGNPTATHNLGVLYRKGGEIGKGVDLLKQASRSERGRSRAEFKTSPETKKIMRTGWAIVILIGLIIFYLFNR